MKKLLSLILLAACADPNAELLAKNKNLEIENQSLNGQLSSIKSYHGQMDIIQADKLAVCKRDLKGFVCAKKNKDFVEWRVLCEKPTLLALQDSEKE